MDMIERFKDYMRGAGAWLDYVYHYCMDVDNTCDLDKFFMDNDEEHWIVCAFYWKPTVEGWGYWDALDRGWQAIVKKEVYHA